MQSLRIRVSPPRCRSRFAFRPKTSASVAENGCSTDTELTRFRSLPTLRFARWIALTLGFTSALTGFAASAESSANYRDVVVRFADAMIERSRVALPHPDLPLFPIVRTRDTFEVPKTDVRNLMTARVPQEFKYTANPHHDQNIYQILYALTEITGEKKYADEADRVLKYFLKNCQEPRFGFYTWGEHLGWDLFRNAPGGFPSGHAADSSRSD